MLAYKNLPNIRGKLTSIKTKWQKAASDPKYNLAGASGHQLPGYATVTTQPHTREDSLAYDGE